MYHFIVYDKITNEIISTGGCSSKKDIPLQATSPNTDVIQGKVNNKDHYRIVNKEIVRKNDMEIEEANRKKQLISKNN